MKTREAVPLVQIIGNKVVQQKPWTFVEIQWVIRDTLALRTAYGFSRCHWRDRWDKKLGVTIARNRAVFAAAQMIAEGEG